MKEPQKKSGAHLCRSTRPIVNDAAPITSRKVFSSVRYRVTRASVVAQIH